MNVILASASPARLSTLRAAGLDPQVVVSGVDESQFHAPDAADLATQLAAAKCRSVSENLADPDSLVIGCDSVLALGGEILGKPKSPHDAIHRWQAMRGRSGVLYTGHCVHYRNRELIRAAATTVHFAVLTDDEIVHYVDSGEPLHVAGAFTIDGLGGAFIDRIEGDHHNVVGISLPLLRIMVTELGLEWVDLWQRTKRKPA